MHASRRSLFVGLATCLLTSPFDVIAGPAHSHWPIDVASAQSAPANQLTKPEFLARAEKNYDDAKAALRQKIFIGAATPRGSQTAAGCISKNGLMDRANGMVTKKAGNQAIHVIKKR